MKNLRYICDGFIDEDLPGYILNLLVGSISRQQIVPDEPHLGFATNVGLHHLGPPSRAPAEHLHEARGGCFG